MLDRKGNLLEFFITGVQQELIKNMVIIKKPAIDIDA